MMIWMKQRLHRAAMGMILGGAALLAWPGVLMADEKTIVDARYEGYASNVTLDGGSTALTWLLFIFLAVLGLSVLFKDARRTHLD